MSRVLALDYGAKRVGAALSDPTRTLATPLSNLPAQPEKQLIDSLRSLTAEKGVALIIIGIPRNMDGSFGPSAEAARAFADRISQNLAIPIRTVDERLSTVQASRMLHEAGHDTRKQKDKIDSASAQILLQSFLDATETPL